VLLTSDKDFGEIVYRLGRAHGGVVLLRLAGVSSEDRAELLAEVIGAHGAELPGSFAVVEPTSVRIRRAPGTNSPS
jgi:predicted nuclease of predicted toxin-antitoxin system